MLEIVSSLGEPARDACDEFSNGSKEEVRKLYERSVAAAAERCAGVLEVLARRQG